jgi:hypothetical protein
MGAFQFTTDPVPISGTQKERTDFKEIATDEKDITATQDKVEASSDATKPILDPTQGETPKDPKKELIEVSGPIGEVYTQALNKVLANENYTFIVNEEKEKKNGVHVLAYRPDQLSLSEVNKIIHNVAISDANYYLIAIENFKGEVTKEMGLLSELPHVKICYHKESLVPSIQNAKKVLATESMQK